MPACLSRCLLYKPTARSKNMSDTTVSGIFRAVLPIILIDCKQTQIPFRRVHILARRSPFWPWLGKLILVISKTGYASTENIYKLV